MLTANEISSNTPPSTEAIAMAYATARQHLDAVHHCRLAKAFDLVVDGRVAFDPDSCAASVSSAASDALYGVCSGYG